MIEDKFGRTVEFDIQDDDSVIATIADAGFTVHAATEAAALTTINAMAPAGYSPPVEPAGIPDVSKRQMLIWLYQNLNKTDQDIQTAIQSISDPMAKEIALITWLNPDGLFRRSDPLFDELAPIFGLTPDQVDAAFVAAALL